MKMADIKLQRFGSRFDLVSPLQNIGLTPKYKFQQVLEFTGP